MFGSPASAGAKAAMFAALAWLAPIASAAPPVPAAGYYPTSALDVRPGITMHVEPAYPEAAARRGVSGKVVIRLYINEKGSVDRVETLRAHPAGYFERATEQAFSRARFTPGMKGKRAVKTRMRIEVSFDTPPPAPPAGLR